MFVPAMFARSGSIASGRRSVLPQLSRVRVTIGRRSKISRPGPRAAHRHPRRGCSRDGNADQPDGFQHRPRRAPRHARRELPRSRSISRDVSCVSSTSDLLRRAAPRRLTCHCSGGGEPGAARRRRKRHQRPQHRTRRAGRARAGFFLSEFVRDITYHLLGRSSSSRLADSGASSGSRRRRGADTAGRAGRTATTQPALPSSPPSTRSSSDGRGDQRCAIATARAARQRNANPDSHRSCSVGSFLAFTVKYFQARRNERMADRDATSEQGDEQARL